MTAIWNTSVWTQERNILTLAGFASGMIYAQIVTTSPSGYSAKYIIPTSGTLNVDLSDLVRLASSGSFTVTEYDSNGTAGATLSRSWTNAGLINPASVLIPTNELGQLFGASIFAPSMMLKPFNNAEACLFETYGSGYDYTSGSIRYMPSENWDALYRENKFTIDDDVLEFWHIQTSKLGQIVLQEPFNCKIYAFVEWTSFTGATRRHIFEVIKQRTETLDPVSLQTIDNQYDERKGRRDGFTLRLEGLNRYDFWYYSDLITSSLVKVSFDGVNWTQVQVTSKEVEIPNNDEGAFNSLEIEVNYKQYDTI